MTENGDSDHLVGNGKGGPESERVSLPATLSNLPWIDGHNHAHTLSWADREQYGLAGCTAMVMVAAGHHWLPTAPATAGDVRSQWGRAFAHRPAIEREHGYEAKLAVGIHTGVRIENVDDLLGSMADYCERDAVVAIGETGVTPTQQGTPWALPEQRAVVEAQMELADAHDLPVILHTPNQSAGPDRSYRPGFGTPGYERRPGQPAESVLEGDNPALRAVEHDVEAMRVAGIDDEQVVASHADPNVTPYLAAETDCFLSYTLGHSWLTGVTAETVADAIEAYGPDRVMVDTDCANVLRSDPLAIKRAIFELYRLGIDEKAIRQVVFENPRSVFGLGTRSTSNA